jgi:hypothetical protein
MRFMSPQQVVNCAVDREGIPTIPSTVTMANGNMVTIWDDREHEPVPIEHPSTEFRRYGNTRRETTQLLRLTLIAYTHSGSEQSPTPAPYTHPYTGALVTPAAPPAIVYPTRGVFVAWAAGLSRIARSDAFDTVATRLRTLGVLTARWDVDRDADGDFVVPALDADATAAGTRARAVWPAWWRKRLPTDSNGDMMATPPIAPSPPTGPRKIGLLLA